MTAANRQVAIYLHMNLDQIRQAAPPNAACIHTSHAWYVICNMANLPLHLRRSCDVQNVCERSTKKPSAVERDYATGY